MNGSQVTGPLAPEEVAALYTVLAARARTTAAAATGAPAARAAWSDPAFRLGVARDWRTSGLPR